ncbi:abscission/NoCut checkpoint regulator [Callorhinchus milii]|uniref:abscission/NoCut checkpoint regulator n=1 Tax=Callorhinchus milii TaxID=7868 RepID=UPI001C3FD73F|nr:abscission/NoCut checkpoint regulator [Callorhinchus milii]
MSGRCFGCASKFGLLRKELGCKNCGHAYCSSCLSYSTLVPRLGNTQQKVCKQCYESLTSGGKRENPARWSPPDNYKRRVAALEARQQKEAGAKKAETQPPALSIGARYRGLSKEDRAIAERLEKLKEETKPKSIPSDQDIALRLASLKNDPVRPIPTTAEMQDRLAVLQGQIPPSQAPKPSYQAPNNRTQTEQVNDLFEQLSEEVAIDYKYSTGSRVEGTAGALNDLNKGIDPRHFNSGTDDNVERFEEERSNLLEQAEAEQENVRQEPLLAMAKRLATLRGEDPNAVTVDDWKHTGQESDEENEELAIQRVLKQVTEEANLDTVSGYNIPVEQPMSAQHQPAGRKVPFAKLQAPAAVPVVEAASADEEELPWCCICNNDAVLRCHGCDGDLYCQRCFREGHDKFDRKEHRTSSYRPPNKKK